MPPSLFVNPPGETAPSPTQTSADPLNERGIVFDVQRASLHDGPGLRTTVFLKGCGLRCAWCHNPESHTPAIQLGFQADLCLACGACVSACQQGVHSIDAAGVHRIDWAACTVDGACVTACPNNALRLYGHETSVAEVMAEVVRDRVYYETSGGGLTLSGGEPTSQIGFCTALLAAAKDATIHTCVETCGIAPRSSYQAILPLTDLFLFDYKATGVDCHRELTHVEPDRILDNLAWLNANGARLHLRCPMIPGVNDTEAHLKAIAELSRRFERIEAVEVMPYHESGAAKYERIGAVRPALATRTPDPADLTRWQASLTTAGCRNLRA